MKVSEFIEWLYTMPQDATVMCIQHYTGTDYYDQGGTVQVEEFISDDCDESNNWKTYHDLYTDAKGDTTLTIGTVGN